MAKLDKNQRMVGVVVIQMVAKDLNISYTNVEHTSRKILDHLGMPSPDYIFGKSGRLRIAKEISERMGKKYSNLFIEAERKDAQRPEMLRQRALRRREKKKKLRAVMGPKVRSRPKLVVKNSHVSSDHKQAEIDAFYASWDWKRVRYDFLKGRDRKCECCGVTPEQGVRVVVDHIKPIRHHWNLRLDAKNLQCLCDDCNMGKGSRDETDWRPSSVLIKAVV